MMTEMLKCIAFTLCNALTALVNIFVHRDRNVILMGAWYGHRFAGNSRFLFQYLDREKARYGLKKVIWVTRDQEICKELNCLGCECYMMKSRKSFYYHFKAGIHMVSTNTASSNATNKKAQGDIMGQLSLGAVRVYLNHGITSIKGNKIRDLDKLHGRERFAVRMYRRVHKNKFLRKYVLCPGGWDRSVYLSPGAESSKRDVLRHLETEQILFWEAGFPELCGCVKYLAQERNVLDVVKKHNKTIFYLPTYRTNDQTGYFHPLNDAEFCEYLRKNHYYWIDKLHPGAKENMNADSYDEEIALKLGSEFDTNVLLREVDVVITDYSSICHTAVYFDRPLIFYWPDHESYLEKDKGVIKEFQNDIAGTIVYNPSELAKALEQCFQSDYLEQWKEKYAEIKETFFDNRVADYDDIAASLFTFIEKNW